jgi:tetratricopeptide (TPR) repeat protein
VDIKRKARGTEIPHRAQRVFFSCDPQNSGEKDSLIADLLSMDAGMDCVVSYLETWDDIDPEALRNELQEHQALALWVTARLLDSMTNGKIPAEYSLAKELNLPILPIAEYGELFPRFTELAGAIHGIARSDGEYRAKLKAQMESFLASEEIIKEIQAKAFTANVFLSYRKIDIREARGVMKALHDLEGYEAVSVWYDNFLTAGRVFSEEIENSIRESRAFALLVTPNLLEKNAEGKDNYVVSTEYPFAKGIDKPVLPVEAIPTDPARFAEFFPGAGSAVSINDRAALSVALRETLGESAYLGHMDSERVYLLGNAYLKGFGLERDFDRGTRLLELASEGSGSSALNAAEQLAGIYVEGIGTGVDYAKALQWRKRAVVLSEQIHGKEDPDTAARYTGIAVVYINQGDYPQALEWLNKALAVYEKTLGKEHPDTATTYTGIAVVYYNQGDYPRALEWHQKALAIREKALGKEHPVTAIIYNNIAGVYHKQSDYLRALEWYQKALAIWEKAFGKEHPYTATIYNNIAGVYDDQGDYPRALEWYQKALAIREKVFGEEHPDTAPTYNGIAVVYYNQGDYQRALEWYQKALAICEKVLGKEHPHTAGIYDTIGSVYQRQLKEYRWMAAGALLGLVPIIGGFVTGHWFIGIIIGIVTAFTGSVAFVGVRRWRIFITYNNTAGVYNEQGDYPQALEWYLKALWIHERLFTKEHPHTAVIYNNIALVYTNQGDYPQALEWYHKALAVYAKAPGQAHPSTATTYNNIAVVYSRQGDYSHAIEWYQKALAIRELLAIADPGKYGKDAEDTRMALKKLKENTGG